MRADIVPGATFPDYELTDHTSNRRKLSELQGIDLIILILSPDKILETNEFRGQVGADWTFLSDAGRHIQKDLDIKEYTDPFHDPMIPHTLVLKPGLIIYSIYNGYWFWGRPSFADLTRDLREVTREIRPDWDI